MSIGTSDVLATLALFLSAYATWKTLKFNERQKSLIESQELLNRRLLERDDTEARAGKQAEMGATFVKFGTSSYRLKIWNKGKCAARNLRIEFPEGNDCFIDSDVQSKFPLEVLEPQQSVELIAAVGIGSKSKHTVSLRWSDELQTHNEKTLYPTL
jgi:glycosyltransferase involved in cell wall biosynthesis